MYPVQKKVKDKEKVMLSFKLNPEKKKEKCLYSKLSFGSECFRKNLKKME